MNNRLKTRESGSCRFCGSALSTVFADLGMSPFANSYVETEALLAMEAFFPLTVFVCSICFLVQLLKYKAPEGIFSDYAYFSSYSDSWLRHARNYTDMATARFGLNETSQVVELASNDGYLLQYFQKKGIPVLGVEPAANVAEVAIAKGIPSVVKFFGKETATQLQADGYAADLMVGNNVLAHVPDINDFVGGIAILLKPTGTITMEFPHLLRLMQENQYDTIYHEHFSYLSFVATERIFRHHGLELYDVEEVPTHGGSLRIYGRHRGSGEPVSDRVLEMRARECAYGLENIDTYAAFAEQVKATKRALLKFLIQAKEEGKAVVGYGAPAKGNTLLNHCGVGADFIDYTVDRSPHKQGRYLPGVRIPIYPPATILQTKPDYVLILPWNLKDEIMEQMDCVRSWGGKFVVPIPTATVLD